MKLSAERTLEVAEFNELHWCIRCTRQSRSPVFEENRAVRLSRLLRGSKEFPPH